MSGPSVAALGLLAATVLHSAAIDVVVSSDGHVEQVTQVTQDIDAKDYEVFRQKHRKDKLEDSLSYNERFQLYQKRRAFVEKHNSKQGITWTAAVNVFADYTDAEFKALLGHRRLGKWWLRPLRPAPPAASFRQAAVVRRHDEARVDWRQNLVSSNYVKQQGACGSCWAVAAAGALEIHAEIAMKQQHSKQVPKNVSFKQLVVQGADCHDVADQHWINGNLPCEGELLPIANPMSVHPPYKRFRKSWGINAMGSMVVEVAAEDGTCGVGVTIGGEAGCYIVEHHLSRFCEGQDPRNIELMWDQMFRATVNYGRKGLPIQAISAVDLALWDLLGKLRQEPVYMLLGGATKPFLPMYTTTSRPELGKAMGFVACKVPCPFGPADGAEGFKKNVKYLKECRDKVGPDFPLMLDCYMALTVPYSITLARRLAERDLHFTWMEEFLPPDAYDGYEEVMKAVGNLGLMLTTGEHEYTRWGFKQLLDKKAAHILQPDITWLGGITEARSVMVMASASDVLVVPHGSSIYSYHLQFAFTNAPLGEFINLSPDAASIQPYFGGLFPDEPLPKDGKITLEQLSKPGFGCTLKKDGLRRPYARSADASAANRRRQTLGDAQKPATMPLMGPAWM